MKKKRKTKPKLRIQSGIQAVIIQPLGLPAWLTGARRCELYRLVASECASAGMSLKPAHAHGLTGFALALEYCELLSRNTQNSDWLPAAGESAFEWAEAFQLPEPAIRRLFIAVGVDWSRD
jgi:hypothetical protein